MNVRTVQVLKREFSVNSKYGKNTSSTSQTPTLIRTKHHLSCYQLNAFERWQPSNRKYEVKSLKFNWSPPSFLPPGFFVKLNNFGKSQTKKKSPLKKERSLLSLLLFKDKYQERTQINPECPHPRGNNLEFGFCEAYLNQATLRDICTIYKWVFNRVFRHLLSLIKTLKGSYCAFNYAMQSLLMINIFHELTTNNV